MFGMTSSGSAFSCGLHLPSFRQGLEKRLHQDTDDYKSWQGRLALRSFYCFYFIPKQSYKWSSQPLDIKKKHKAGASKHSEPEFVSYLGLAENSCLNKWFTGSHLGLCLGRGYQAWGKVEVRCAGLTQPSYMSKPAISKRQAMNRLLCVWV